MRLLRSGLLLLGLIASTSYGASAHATKVTKPPKPFPRISDFTFVRLEWKQQPGMTAKEILEHDWMVDDGGAESDLYAGADRCLSTWIKKVSLTNVDTNFVHFPIESERLFQYPFAYMPEVGYLLFTDKQVLNLRSWLLKGGFLWIDDFHGPMDPFEKDHKPTSNEWSRWMIQLQRVIPAKIEEPGLDWSEETRGSYEGRYVMLRLTADHPIFRVFSDFHDSKTGKNYIPRLPGVFGTKEPTGYEHGGKEQYVMGLFDPKGRMLAVMNYNMDLGDGLERCNFVEFTKKDITYRAEQVIQDASDGVVVGLSSADIMSDWEYAQKYSMNALRLATNYVIYAMTH